LARRLALAAAVTTAALLGVGEAALHRHWASDLVLTLGLILLVAVGVWTTVQRLLGRPLRRLTGELCRAREGDFLIRAHCDREDEIGELAHSFNQLLATITDLNVNVIDAERTVAAQQRELVLHQELAEKERVLSQANRQMEQ